MTFETVMNLERNEFLETDSHPNNKGNGYYERAARALTKYFKLKVPRDRLGLFRPVFLQALNNEKEKIDELAFSMYSKGVSTRDIADIIKEVFGQNYSASSVSNITSRFTEIREAWQNRSLSEEYYFVYIDATYLFVKRNSKIEKEAFYIVMGVTQDLKREILGVYNYPSETSLSYQEIFSDLQKRGFKKCLLFIADGFKGIKKALKEEFPQISLQTCLFHKLKNLKPRIRANKWGEFLNDYNTVFRRGDSSYTKEKALEELESFLCKWSKEYNKIRNHFNEKDKKYMVAYLDFPYDIQTMIYTTNWIERVNKEIKKITYAKNSFPNENSALNLVCSILMDREERSWKKYPITKFKNSQKRLNEMLEKI